MTGLAGLTATGMIWAAAAAAAAAAALAALPLLVEAVGFDMLML